MMLPFKKGPFHLAVAAQLPIIPIVCENYASAYSAQTRRFNGGDLVIKGAFRFVANGGRGGADELRFAAVLPPISTVGISSSSEDIAALVERTRTQMVEAIEELGRRRVETNRLKAVFQTPEE